MAEEEQPGQREPTRRLSEEDVALVIRRAAELDTLSNSSTGIRALDEATLVEVGREVGLSEGAMQRALGELRGGILRPAARVGILGPPIVTARRVVEGPVTRVGPRLRTVFKRQLFEPIRSLDTMMFFARRADLGANLARGFKKPRLRHVRTIEASTLPVSDHLVEVNLRADVGQRRAAAMVAFGVAGAGATAGTAAGVGLALTVAPPLLLVMAPSVALSAAIVVIARQTFDRAIHMTQLALDGILDELE